MHDIHLACHFNKILSPFCTSLYAIKLVKQLFKITIYF